MGERDMRGDAARCSNELIQGEALAEQDERVKGIALSAGQGGQREDHALSRRSFMSAVGALVTLPAVAGGVLMPVWTDEAYAAEGDNGGTDSNVATSKLIVVKKNEFGIVVCDMVDNKKVPVQGASVKLRECGSGKEVSGTTDSAGKVLLDVSTISKLQKDDNGVELYSFYAEMDISAKGYRNYSTGRISVTGGRGVMAPTRKLDNEKIYPQKVTFDDWDVLYTQNSFAVTVGNDVKHTFKIELVADTTKPVLVRIFSNRRRESSLGRQKVTPTNGIVKVEFSNYYLLKNHDMALDSKDGVRLVIDHEDDYQRSFDLAMNIQDAPNAVTAPGTAKLTLSPFDPNKLKPQITLPDWIPLLGGKVVDVWTPELPVSLWFDPYGFVKFVARTGELGYKLKDKNGVATEDAWKYHPCKSSEEQWDEVNKDRQNLVNKVGKAIRGKGGLAQSVSYTGKLKATAMLQIAAAGKWRNDEALWRMGISAQAVLAFNVSYAQQFLIGPFPFIFEFGFLSSITVGVSMAVATTDLFEISKYSWDYGNAGISMTIVIAPSISLGIGVKGLLSASVQGQLSFSFCVAARAVPHDAGKDLKNPHVVMGLVAQVNIVVQAFIFTKTFEWLKTGDATLYDNWNGKVPGKTPPSLGTQADEWSVFGDGMEIVSEEDLLQVGEFEGEGFDESALSTQSDGASAVEPVVVESQTVDGISYRCEVFDPAASALSAQSASVRTVGAGGGAASLAAGTSSALTTQDDANKEPASKIPSEAKYSVTDAQKYSAFVEERTTKRFKGVASQTGLIPANDLCVAKGVFSDPRIEAARIGDKTYLFRIATTKINGQPRTRIVGQVLGSDGKPANDMKVYDFSIQQSIFSADILPSRNDLYDYDFDVLYSSVEKPLFSVAKLIDFIRGRKVKGVLTFFVISGKREMKDKTSFGQAACDQVFSIVDYYVFEDGEISLVSANAATTANSSFDAAGGGTQFPFHSFSCPQISEMKGQSGNTYGWMLTYLDRAGVTADDTMRSDEGKVKVGLGVCFMDLTGKITAVKTHELVEKVHPVDDASIYEMTCSSRLAVNADGSGWYLAMLRGKKEALYYLLRAAPGSSSLFFNVSPVLEVKAIKVMGTDKSEPMRLVEWPGHAGTFLTSKSGKLQKVTIEGLGQSSPSLKYEDCGLSTFNVNSFGLDPTGSVIFWPACNEDNAGYSYDENGKGTKRKAVEVHQVMASRLRNGTFSDPFVYGEVTHDMHVMQVLDYLKASTLTIISVDMTDATKGKADLWFTSIPLVKCANIIGCEAASQFTFPGEKALFYLTVRNDGNVFLSGFTAKLSERGKDAVSSAKLVFSKETLCESGYNPADGGSLRNIEPDYALAPGKTSVYQVEIDIPKDWKDEKKVCVLAVDAVVAQVGGVKTQGALGTQTDDDMLASLSEKEIEEIEEYVIGTGDLGAYDYDEELDNGEGQMPFDVIDIWYEDGYDNDEEEDYQDAPPADGEQGGGTDDSGDGASDTGQGAASAGTSLARAATPSTGKTPSTGDFAFPFGLAATAVAAAGAGMVAYSKRRTELERERQGSDETPHEN